MEEFAYGISVLAIISMIPKEIWKGLIYLVIIGIVVFFIYNFSYWALGYEDKDKEEYYAENFWKNNMDISSEIVNGLNMNKETIYSYSKISKENNVKSFEKELKPYHFKTYRYASPFDKEKTYIEETISYTYSIFSGAKCMGSSVTVETIRIKCDYLYCNKEYEIRVDEIDIFLSALNKAKESEKIKEIAEEKEKNEEERINSLYADN